VNIEWTHWGGRRHRVFLVEALAGGLELRLLSERLKGYDGEAYVFTPSGLGPDQRRAVWPAPQKLAHPEC